MFGVAQDIKLNLTEVEMFDVVQRIKLKYLYILYIFCPLYSKYKYYYTEEGIPRGDEF